MALPAVNYEEIRTQGWTIVKNMLEPDLCRRLRECTDHIVGAEQCESGGVEGFREGHSPHFIDPHNSEVFDIDIALQAQQSVCGTRNYRHGIRHPIISPGSGPLLAEAATAGNMVAMQKELLRTDAGLRLMQQQLVRSDPDPKAMADGSTPNGWHMDTSFLPKHYSARPQQNVHHVVTALSKVEPGGAAFMIVPNSFQKCKEITGVMPAEEQASLRDSDFRTKLRPQLLSQVDTSSGIELLMEEGDACVFDQVSAPCHPLLQTLGYPTPSRPHTRIWQLE